MPEVLNPEVITPEQRTWANAILRLAGGAGGTESPSPTPTSEDQPNKSGTQTQDSYGEGLQSKSVLQDGRTLPISFTNALTRGAPMLSKEDWLKVMEDRRPTPSQIEEIIQGKDTLIPKLKLAHEKRKALNPKLAVLKLLNKAKAKNTSCDLSAYKMGVIAVGDVDAKLLKQQNLVNSLQPEVDQLNDETGKALFVLDSPENNPEHLEVAEGLGDLAKLEQKLSDGKIDKKDYVKAKADLIYGLEAVVFKWVNRRMHQNLPASNDAVAMADMIQRVHQDLIKDVIDEGLPLPMSMENEVLLSEEEKAEVQETWKKLVASKTTTTGPGNRLSIPVPKVDNNFINSTEEAEQFRIDMLSNMARLTQSTAGRDLLRQLNGGEKKVTFIPGSSPACGVPANTGLNGVPTDCTILMMVGQKDSTRSYSSTSGGALFASVPVTLGHEMIHALHGTRGKMKHKELPPEDKLWNNREEYNTIRKGKLSEQTLRHQYGMLMDRFAHLVPPVKDEVYDAIVESIEVASEMGGRDRTMVDGMLTVRKFDPKKIPDKLKTKLADSSLHGPIPPGWDPSQLTFEQLEEILKNPALVAKLHEFGWTPYGLNRARIEQIYENKEHHVRSPKGIRMRALGGDAGLSEFANFESKTEYKLTQPAGPTWEDKLDALEAADKVLIGIANTHEEPSIQKAAEGSSKVQKRMAAIIKAYESFEPRLANHGGDPAINAIDGFNEHVANKKLAVHKTDVISKVNTLDQAARWLEQHVKSVPSELQGPLKSGNTGAKLLAATNLWKTTKEEIEKRGGFSTRAVVLNYNRALSRNLALPKGSDLFSVLQTLKLAETDLAKLKSETKYEPMKTAISGSDVPKDLVAAQKAAKALQLEFVSYGGKDGLAAIPAISQLTGVTLEAKAIELSAQIEECKAAAEALEKFAAGEESTEIKSIVKSKSPLQGKLALLQKVQQRKEATENATVSLENKTREMEEQGTAMVAMFDGAKVSKAIGGVDPGKSRIKTVTDAYQTLSTIMNSLPSSIPGLLPALDDLEQEAQDYLNHPDHQNPWLPAGKKRRALCEELLLTVEGAKAKYNGVQEKAREAVVEARELANNPDDVSLSVVDGLAALANNDYLSVEVQKELTDAINELATAVDEAALKREASLSS